MVLVVVLYPNHLYIYALSNFILQEKYDRFLTR